MALLIDAETILAGIEQWLQLETKWGTPIDLDDSEDLADEDPKTKMRTAFSCMDMKKSFGSSFAFKASERKAGRYSSKTSVTYTDFTQDLKTPRKIKPFFFVSGELLSADSVEDICEGIDKVFKSLEKLCSATSTVRFTHEKKRPSIDEVVQCSISTAGLSFDDTVMETNEDIDRYIDEVFNNLHSTLVSLSRTLDESSKETVTNLVKKFTTILKSPELKCSPGLRRQCGDKFRDLAAFWQDQATSKD